MKKFLIATTLMLGLGAFALPASANSDDHGQYIYTQNDPSRFAPAGLNSDEAGARDTVRDRLFERIDEHHRQY